jgi:hypothetical protein
MNPPLYGDVSRIFLFFLLNSFSLFQMEQERGRTQFIGKRAWSVVVVVMQSQILKGRSLQNNKGVYIGKNHAEIHSFS